MVKFYHRLFCNTISFNQKFVADYFFNMLKRNVGFQGNCVDKIFIHFARSKVIFFADKRLKLLHHHIAQANMFALTKIHLPNRLNEIQGSI